MFSYAWLGTVQLETVPGIAGQHGPGAHTSIPLVSELSREKNHGDLSDVIGQFIHLSSNRNFSHFEHSTKTPFYLSFLIFSKKEIYIYVCVCEYIYYKYIK